MPASSAFYHLHKLFVGAGLIAQSEQLQPPRLRINERAFPLKTLRTPFVPRALSRHDRVEFVVDGVVQDRSFLVETGIHALRCLLFALAPSPINITSSDLSRFACNAQATMPKLFIRATPSTGGVAITDLLQFCNPREIDSAHAQLFEAMVSQNWNFDKERSFNEQCVNYVEMQILSRFSERLTDVLVDGKAHNAVMESLCLAHYDEKYCNEGGYQHYVSTELNNIIKRNAEIFLEPLDLSVDLNTKAFQHTLAKGRTLQEAVAELFSGLNTRFWQVHNDHQRDSIKNFIGEQLIKECLPNPNLYTQCVEKTLSDLAMINIALTFNGNVTHFFMYKFLTS